MYIRGQVKHNIIKDQYIRGICMNDCGGFCLELSKAGSVKIIGKGIEAAKVETLHVLPRINSAQYC